MGGLAVWFVGRTRGEARPWRASWKELLALAFLAGIVLAPGLYVLGPRATEDTLRDLWHAFGIARLGEWPVEGPGYPINERLTPLWYYLLAPAFLPSSPSALVGLLLAWQTATVVALFALVRRLADGPVAWLACALWMGNRVVVENLALLTHSNLLFLVALLALHALVDLQLRSRSAAVVPLLFWLSAGLQLHITAVLLVPVALLVALDQRRDAAWADVFVGLFAGFVPFLLGGGMWWPGGEPLLQAGSRLLGTNTALVPSVVVALLIARPGMVARTEAKVLWGTVLVLWTARALVLADRVPVRLFNLALPRTGMAAPPDANPAEPAWWLLAFGGGGGAHVAVAAVCAVVGLAVCGHSAYAREQGSVDRPAARLLVVWAACTVVGGLVVHTYASPAARYLSEGALALAVVVAVGARWGWQRVVAWVPAVPQPARAAGWLVLIWLAARGRLLEDPPPRGVATDAVIASTLLGPAGVLPSELLHRVHGASTVIHPQQGVVALWGHAAWMGDTRTAATQDRRHWQLGLRSADRRSAELVDVPGTPWQVERYLSALRIDEAVLASAVRVRGDESLTRIALPIYAADDERYPPALSPRYDVVPGALIAGADGVVVDVTVPRDTPSVRSLDTVAVLATPAAAALLEGAASTSCEVDVQVDGVPRPTTREGDVWRVGGLSTPVAVRVVVRGCALGALDVWDVPAGW